MKKARYAPSVEYQKKAKFYPSVEYQEKAKSSKPSKADKVIGTAVGIVERGGGGKRPVEEVVNEYTGSAQDLGLAFAQGATFNHADEIYGGVKALGGGDYEESRDVVREQWQEARKRSPGLTMAGEVVGATLSPASKILGPAKGLRGIVRGAIEGALHGEGASDAEFGSKDHLSDTAMGAGVGGATGAVANVLTKGYKKEPNALRAEVTGTRPKDWKVSGPGDRRSSIDRLKDSGFYSRDKMEFDPNSLSFKKANKSKFRIDEIEKNTEDRLLGRAQEAVEQIQQKKEREFGQLLNGRRVPRQRLDDLANELIDEYSERGLLKGSSQRAEAVEKVLANIDEQIVRMGDNPNAPSLATLDKIKRMAQEDVKNFSKSLSELGDNEELMRITSRKLKEVVEDNLGSTQLTEKFRKYNGAQHDYLNITQDLKNQIAKLDLAPGQRTQLERTNFAEQFVDGLMGGSDGKLGRAEIGDFVRKIPGPVRAVTPYALQEVPGVAVRQNFMGEKRQGNAGRSPQSVPGVDTFGREKEFNIPEELIRTPLPRTTQELLEKKKFVLMKVAQMAPEHFETFQDVLENDPESIPDLIPVLAERAPHFFAKDKYDRFDGRVLTEKGRNKAMKDTLSREDLNSVQKAKILTKLNKEGVFED